MPVSSSSNKLNSKGFSLIELLVAGGLSAFIFIFIINTLIFGLNRRNQASITTSLQKTATHIVNDITKYTRWANVVQTTPNSITITTENNQLISYYLSGPNLLRSIPNSNNVKLNPNDIAVTEFNIVSHPSTTPTDLTINLKLQHQTSAQYTFSSTSTVAVRVTTLGSP